LGIFDIFRKKQNNVERGREIEDQFENENSILGGGVKRTGIGSDFEKLKRDPLTGRVIGKEKWEIKRNNSPLSERQKQTHGLKVYRAIDTPLGQKVRIEDKQGTELVKDWDGRWRRVTERDRDPFGINNLVGSSNSNKGRRNDSDPFGLGSVFGSSEPRKRKTPDYDSLLGFDIFGNDNRSRRRRRSDDQFSIF
jgi:hypothetical protein